MPVLMLELNELNLDDVRAYAERGHLPELAQLIERHGITETTSEQKYDQLEPWIQWVTAHTGLSLAEHGVYRLGDIEQHDIPQIWEVLEQQGLKVGAISPMNAKNRCRSADFFVPDPWTRTEISGSRLLKKVYGAVAQAVNDNASSKVTPASAAWLALGLCAYARFSSVGRYVSLFGAAARRRSWAKPLILDQLLTDIFIRGVKRSRPDFASLFLNAGAHIQHHYMFNSGVYRGDLSNPDWYVPSDADPVLDVYAQYDRIVGQVRRAAPDARLIIATGLHQDPHDEVTFYWRLKEHESFLAKAAIPFQRVEPRMSRDFVVYCRDADEAARAAQRLGQVQTRDGTALFDVDNRGTDLFVMLTWPHDIDATFEYRVGNGEFRLLRDEVAFVAIKNGEHNGVGYLIDTGERVAETARIPLAALPQRIAQACGAKFPLTT